MGSGLPNFFLGRPAADSTATRNMTEKISFHLMHFHSDVSLYVKMCARCSALIHLGEFVKGVGLLQ